jgi:Holliday junction resolvase RusA-like endonuclease
MVINKTSFPIKFEMDLPPQQIRGNNRSHHFSYNKHFQAYLQSAIGNILEAINMKNLNIPYSKTIVVYTFMNNRSIDIDNFIYGMKAVQDALTQTNIIDDDDALTISPIAKFVKCPIKQRKVLIEVWNIGIYANVSIMADSELLLRL